jgi:dUTP pyrophosphatase
MKEYNITLMLDDNIPPPERATEGSAGFDIAVSHDMLLTKGTHIVGTGITAQIPENMCGLILPRSSLHKLGLSLANQVGLIDSDYRGEIKLILAYDGFNPLGDGIPLKLLKGTRLAQLVFLELPNTFFTISKMLSDSKRGVGGVGSTGV